MSAYSDAMLAHNPLFYVRCGEASGTTLVDESPNNHDGTYVGGFTLGTTGLLTGDPDTCVTLNGTSGCANIPFGSWMDVPNITVIAWIETLATGVRSIVDRDQSLANRVWQFRHNGGLFQFIKIGGTGGTVTATAATAPNDGTRHMLAATYDGSNIRLYQDGVLVNTTAAVGALATGTSYSISLGVNGFGVGGFQFFQGDIDEAAYLGSVLTQPEIEELWLIGSTMPPDPPMNLAVDMGVTTGLFSWDTVVGATSYEVRIDGGTPIDVGLSLDHLFTGLTPETLYTFEVRTLDGVLTSEWALITGMTLPVPPVYPEPVIFPPADPLCVPVSNLGQGRNVAMVQTRGGGQILGELPASQLAWGRRLDDLSETNVTIPVSSMSDACCGLLADTHTWGHELVVFRDGERVWEGPIVTIRENEQTGVVVRALDVYGYMLRRVHRGRSNGAPVFAIDEAEFDVTDAFTLGGWDGADPNVLAYLEVQGAGTGPTTEREIPALSAYYFDTLDQLGDAGVNFTTVGRRIILWPDTLTLGRVPTLLPTQHLSSDVTIVEDGMSLSELAIVTSDNQLWGASSVPSFPTSDPFYGPVETLTNIPNLATTAACDSAADSIRAQGFPTPVLLEIPDGSTLTTDAPYAIGDLVPGVLMPVSHQGKCRSVAADFVLTSVQATQTPEGETVQISVAPLSASVES